MKKNIVCTGGNVGILNSTIHQIISRSTSDTPYKIIISSQSHYSTSALESLIPVQSNIQLIWLQLDLNDLNNVREFAKSVNNELNGESIDMLIINAAVFKTNGVVGKDDGWSEEARANHFSQHYLIKLFLPSLSLVSDEIGSHEISTRIIYITSAKYTSIDSIESLEPILRLTQPSRSMERYAASKFVQLVGAHRLSLELQSRDIDVIAISPGFVPTSELSRDASSVGRFFMKYVMSWAPFATSLSSAGESLCDIITLPTHRLRSFRLEDSNSPVIYLDKDLNSLALDDRILSAGDEWV